MRLDTDTVTDERQVWEGLDGQGCEQTEEAAGADPEDGQVDLAGGHARDRRDGGPQDRRRRQDQRRPGADTPQEIPPQGWLDIARRTRKEVNADQVPLLAAGRRLRQGTDVVQRWGRGPLADRLRRPITTATGTDKPGR